MASRSVPQEQWVTFCDDVSRRYRGQTATLTGSGATGEGWTIARDTSFEGIGADLKDRERDVTIMFGQDMQLTHIANAVTDIIDDLDDSLNPSITIATADDQRVVLTLRPAS